MKGDLVGEPWKGTVPALDEIAKFLPAGRAGGPLRAAGTLHITTGALAKDGGT